MRNSVLWKRIHVRLSLAACIALLGSLAIAGCGGGGGSSTNTTGGNGSTGNTGTGGGTPQNSLAVVSGTVQDTNGVAAPGVTVSIVGTTLAATTGSNGKYQINNVPLTATQFQVSYPQTPFPPAYYNVGSFDGVTYNLGTNASSCDLPLPTPLKASSVSPTALPVIQMAIGGSNPPPAPISPLPAGCPKG